MRPEGRIVRAMGWIVLGLALGLASAAFRVFPYPQIRDVSLWLVPALDNARPSAPAARARRALFERVTPDVDVAAIGDSIIARGLWGDVLPEHRVANRGLSGDTTAGILARLDAILATRPEQAVIMAGINDLMQGRNLDEIGGDYAAILDRLSGAGVRILVLGTLECRRTGCGAINPQVQALNSRTQLRAEAMGAQFIDPNSILSDSDGLRADLTPDGVHLNAEGFFLLAQIVRRGLAL